MSTPAEGMPSDYVLGYQRGVAINRELAANYIAHTTIGDPVADAVAQDLRTLDPDEGAKLVRACLDGAPLEPGITLPDSFQRFSEELENPPAWLDYDAFAPGIRMFHRNSKLILAVMLGGVLVEGFSTNISKSFFITGRLRDSGVRRLKQNNRHMLEIFLPGGLEKYGDGWKLSNRVRLVHAQVRHLLRNSEDWDEAAWGTPLSAAHVGFAITAFSARLLRHAKRLGATFDDQEAASFMQVWRYSGHLMGIPETILYHNQEDALRLFEVGGACEPPPDFESVAMANSLVNSAAMVVGIPDRGRASEADQVRVCRLPRGHRQSAGGPAPLSQVPHLRRAGLVQAADPVGPGAGQAVPQPGQEQHLRRLHGGDGRLQLRHRGHRVQAAGPRLRGEVDALVTPDRPR